MTHTYIHYTLIWLVVMVIWLVVMVVYVYTLYSSMVTRTLPSQLGIHEGLKARRNSRNRNRNFSTEIKLKEL